MSPAWKQITPAQAEAHPLYGVKNWLAIFAFGVLVGFLRDLNAVNFEARSVGMSVSAVLALDLPAITFLKLALAVDGIAVGGIYWLLFSKSRHFRVAAMTILLLSFPLVAAEAILNPFDGSADVIAPGLVAWAISCAVWVTYLNRSRRVRVTFEHAIRASESQPASKSKVAVATTQKPAASLPAHLPETRSLDLPPRVAPVRSSSVSGESVGESDSAPSPDDGAWEAALIEYEGPGRRQGLWARAFSEADGNESVTKARYLRLRATELELDSRALLAQEQIDRETAALAESTAAILVLAASSDKRALSTEVAVAVLRYADAQVTERSGGTWEVLLPSRVTVFARSTDDLQKLANRFIPAGEPNTKEECMVALIALGHHVAGSKMGPWIVDMNPGQTLVKSASELMALHKRLRLLQVVA